MARILIMDKLIILLWFPNLRRKKQEMLWKKLMRRMN